MHAYICIDICMYSLVETKTRALELYRYRRDAFSPPVNGCSI